MQNLKAVYHILVRRRGRRRRRRRGGGADECEEDEDGEQEQASAVTRRCPHGFRLAPPCRYEKYPLRSTSTFLLVAQWPWYETHHAYLSQVAIELLVQVSIVSQ
jgi:hypothetical protein